MCLHLATFSAGNGADILWFAAMIWYSVWSRHFISVELIEALFKAGSRNNYYKTDVDRQNETDDWRHLKSNVGDKKQTKNKTMKNMKRLIEDLENYLKGQKKCGLMKTEETLKYNTPLKIPS